MPLDWTKQTYIMGIVNVTDDSFSGDGVLLKSLDEIKRQVTEFLEAGVDILDIGGESTRPGSVIISEKEEIKRVIPVIKEIRAMTDIPISVDTYKAEVARQALEAGADWVNDVWGLQMDPLMAKVVAETKCPIVIMHNRSKPKEVDEQQGLGGRYVGVEYEDLVEDIKRELLVSVTLARENGIQDECIILDPGIGFGKTVEQNLILLNKLSELKSLGFPILLGPSRKSFIGYTLDLPPDERVEGTAATVAVGIVRGANIIRVHDVKQMVRVAKMTDAILKS
ncbi:MAG: dihydropteroate synthase [Candidatus Heimdallarchaeota archaeon]|nr:dihydropteroate synthase [Candidatus Heimdallarchaeota archaeon]